MSILVNKENTYEFLRDFFYISFWTYGHLNNYEAACLIIRRVFEYFIYDLVATFTYDASLTK